MWSERVFSINGESYYAEIKHFEQPSEFGINGGKISKLRVATDENRNTVAAYDRGWFVKPSDEDSKQAVRQILSEFN